MSELKINKLKLGVVCSTAGGTILAAVDIFNSIYPNSIEIVVATDRECGIESICQERGILHQRFLESDKKILCSKISDFFKQQTNLTIVILYFVRLISKDLYGQFPTLNIHPSLLPAFPGFRAIERALESDAKVLGATLHLVDKTVDGGPIISQNIHTLPSNISIEDARRLSFSQKVFLTLLLFELLVFKKMKFKINQNGNYLPINTMTVNSGKTEYLGLSSIELKVAYNSFLDEECLSVYKV